MLRAGCQCGKYSFALKHQLISHHQLWDARNSFFLATMSDALKPCVWHTEKRGSSYFSGVSSLPHTSALILSVNRLPPVKLHSSPNLSIMMRQPAHLLCWGLTPVCFCTFYLKALPCPALKTAIWLGIFCQHFCEQGKKRRLWWLMFHVKGNMYGCASSGTDYLRVFQEKNISEHQSQFSPRQKGYPL